MWASHHLDRQWLTFDPRSCRSRVTGQPARRAATSPLPPHQQPRAAAHRLQLMPPPPLGSCFNNNRCCVRSSRAGSKARRFGTSALDLEVSSACCKAKSDSLSAFFLSTGCARLFKVSWAGASKAERCVETAPPAVQPPSLAFPTAAFHVGRCAVVMV